MSSTKSPNERVDSALRDLEKLRRGFQRGTWLTAIVGFLLLALLAGYFCYGYFQIKILADPENLVALVGTTLDSQIPVVRQSVETQVNDNAAVWAEQTSQQIVAYAPTLREHVETAALAQTDDLIDKFTVMGETQFRRVIDENRDTMKNGLQQLKANEELDAHVMELFEAAFEKELQVSMESQSEELTAALTEINERLAQLGSGEGLEPEEVIHRRILMLARRMMMEQFDPENLAKIDSARATSDMGSEGDVADDEDDSVDAGIMDDPAPVEKAKPEVPKKKPEVPKEKKPEAPKQEKPAAKKPATDDEDGKKADAAE